MRDVSMPLTQEKTLRQLNGMRKYVRFIDSVNPNMSDTSMGPQHPFVEFITLSCSFLTVAVLKSSRLHPVTIVISGRYAKGMQYVAVIKDQTITVVVEIDTMRREIKLILESPAVAVDTSTPRISA